MPAGDDGVETAAELFRVLGSPARLRLLRLIAVEPVQVTALAERAGMTQPLVSQHLRVLRQASIVTAVRTGREVLYRLSDRHIAHVIEDAVAHGLEDQPNDANHEKEIDHDHH